MRTALALRGVDATPSKLREVNTGVLTPFAGTPVVFATRLQAAIVIFLPTCNSGKLDGKVDSVIWKRQEPKVVVPFEVKPPDAIVVAPVPVPKVTEVLAVVPNLATPPANT